jgi:hypothetical protein
MVHAMVARPFARRIVTLVLALGVFLSGAAPSWAMPTIPAIGTMPAGVSMSMPGMAMQTACTPDRGTPTKNAPCKNTDSSCAVCTACAVPVVLLQQTSPVRLTLHGQDAVFPQDVNRNGIAVLPALPPPILSA